MTQTISVAVVAVELTGNISMLLPCLIASVIAAGVTRTMGLSVYDQAMFNKSLQSLQLLLRESMHNFRFASDVMQSGNEIVCIPRQCSSIYLLQILDESRDSQFPVVDDLKSRKLLGTLGRSEIFQYLRGTFHDWSMDELLAKLLPEDDHEWESRMNREATIEEHKRLRTIVYNSLTMKFCAECIHPDTEADVEAPYVPRTRQKRPADMNSLSDYIPGSVLGGPLDMSEENLVASEMEEGKDTAGSYPHYSGNNTLSGDDISENFVPGSDIVFSDAVSGRIYHCSSTDRPIFSTEGVSECSPPSVMTHVATAASDNVRPGEEILPPHPSEDQLYQEMQHSVTRNRNVSWAPTMQKDRSRSVTSAVSSQRSLDRGEIDDAAPDTDVGVQNISRPRVLSFVEIAVCKVSQFLQDLPEGTRNIPSRTPPTREASTSAAGSISQDQQLTADVELVGMKRTSSIESELDSYQLRRRTRTLSRETTITATGIRSAIKAGGGKSVTNLNVLNTACTDRTEVTADRKRENNTNNDPTMMASASSHTGDQASTDFKDALKKDIDLLEQRHQRSVEGGRENLLTVSAFPFSVTSTTSMEHIYVLLEMVKLLHIYVQEDGRLIGIISRRKLLAKLKACGNP